MEDLNEEKNAIEILQLQSIKNISLKDFDCLIDKIKTKVFLNNELEDVIKNHYLKVVSKMEEITNFQVDKIEIENNSFKTEIKSGLINLLEIKNEFPYLVEKSFSIKKNQKFEDIKNNNKDKNLFLYEDYFEIFKIIQKHFKENEKLTDLNLKDTFLNLEITIPKENIEFLVNKTRASFDTTQYLRSLYSNIDKTFEINFNEI